MMGRSRFKSRSGVINRATWGEGGGGPAGLPGGKGETSRAAYREGGANEEEYESKQTPMSVETLAPSTSTSSPVTSPKTNLFKRPADPILLESPAIKSAR
uniref:(California timema) hypothetical protein n=1 Tax=Timema californicum TaxID=61474 RepID=A0A7R9JIX6_TIMCA|nr:unnamed protein product [Timema californicum]